MWWSYLLFSTELSSTIPTLFGEWWPRRWSCKACGTAPSMGVGVVQDNKKAIGEWWLVFVFKRNLLSPVGGWVFENEKNHLSVLYVISPAFFKALIQVSSKIIIISSKITINFNWIRWPEIPPPLGSPCVVQFVEFIVAELTIWIAISEILMAMYSFLFVMFVVRLQVVETVFSDILGNFIFLHLHHHPVSSHQYEYEDTWSVPLFVRSAGNED